MKWDKNHYPNFKTEEIKSVRANAIKKQALDVIELCEKELEQREPKKLDRYVKEFHVVCPTEKDVVINPDGTFWSGSWVIARVHAEKAIQMKSCLALHAKKSNPSYRQGTVINYPIFRQGPSAQNRAGRRFIGAAVRPTI